MFVTYNLGFFLGPGLPRGLGVPLDSNICPRLLLYPGAGPLRFLEGSEELASPFEGAGVELDSEVLSLISVIFKAGTSSSTGAGEEADDCVDSCSSSLAEGGSKRWRSFGEILRMTTLPCFLFLSPRAVVAAGDPVVFEDETAMIVGCGLRRTRRPQEDLRKRGWNYG